MPSIKVSVDFLEGSVAKVISKGSLIAKSMTNNKVFRLTPISPEGLQTAIDHLKEMEKKAKGGRQQDIINRDEALSDAGDFFRQTADFLNHGSFPKDLLDTSGFDFTDGSEHKPAEESHAWTGRIM